MELILKHTRTQHSCNRGVVGRIGRPIARIREWQKLRRKMRHVSRLSEHLLRDIGLQDYTSLRRDSAWWPER